MAVSSFVSWVASGGFEALSRALLSVVILDNQINVGVFVVTRMPPKRGQNYTERELTNDVVPLTAVPLQMGWCSHIHHVFSQSSCRNLQMLPGQPHSLPFQQKYWQR